MSVLVRNEKFGYIIFNTTDRKHIFVKSKSKINPDISITDKKFLCKKLDIDYTDDIYVVGNNNINYRNRLSAPMCLYLEITEWCPLDCKHCYKPDKKELSRSLTLLEFINIIHQAKSMGVFEVRLCGNEPVLSEYFIDICNEIKHCNMHLSINTSGNLNNDLIQKLISVNPNFVVVSMDGNKTTHNDIRNTGAYERSFELLTLLQHNRINRRINCVLSKKTINHLEDVVVTASEKDCGISFIPLRTMGKKTDFKNDEALSKKDILYCINKITSLRNSYPNVPMEMFFDIIGGDFVAHHNMQFNTPCPAGKNGFITAQGEFFPCDWIRYLGKKYYCGNLLKENLEHIWNNSKILIDFQCIKRKNCYSCRHYLKRCYGGCWCSYLDKIADQTYEDKLCPLELIKN